MSPAASRALDPLRFRPLLWMALCALAGVAAGGALSQFLGLETRADWRWAWPLFPALLAAAGAWQVRAHGIWRRLWISLCLFCGFASGAARRVLPPDGDVSHLTRAPIHLDGPLRPVGLTLHGTVADYPKNSDFSTQFPLKCSVPRAGLVWVSAPFGTPLQIGDEVEVELELEALPRPDNPGERADFWRFIGQGCWCIGRKPGDFRRIGVDSSYTFARRIGDWRLALLHHYERAFRGDENEKSREAALRLRPFPATTAQLLTAMAFGEGGLSQPLPQQVRDDFRAAGLSHILVASGTQVSLIVVLILWFLERAGLKHSKMLLLAVPLLVFYALLAGSAISIWRATIGGFLLLYALLLGRDVDGLSLWGGAILVLLVLDPLTAWSLSFQLTFAATWGLLTLAPALSRLFERHFGSGAFLQLAAFSLGAQLATMPISLFHFGSFSVSGLGANFLAIPVAGIMVGTGLIGLIFPPINWLNYVLTRSVASVAHSFALLPGARLSGAPLELPNVWAFYALFLVAIWPLSASFDAARETWRQAWQSARTALTERAGSLRPRALSLIFVGLGLGVWWLLRGPISPNLRVTMLDVGQGECILIRAPSGQNILIDGGSLDSRARSDIGAQVIVPALQSLGVERLDLVILTHADADHCNGLAAVAREIPITAFLDGPSASGRLPDPAQSDYFELRRVLAARKIPIVVPRADQKWQLGAAQLQVLAPTLPLLGDTNDDGVVCRVSLGQSSLLFCADIEAGGEARLLERGVDLQCSVLKVAHHGSKTSSSPAFLRAAHPAAALISCGQYNRFGHPATQTLHALQDAQIAAYRTDLNGALQVECDATSCAVTPFR